MSAACVGELLNQLLPKKLQRLRAGHNCETIGKTRQTTITNKSGTFNFTFDKCRTLTAKGPIADIPEINEDRNKTAQTDMLDLFFGKGKLASPLRVPGPPKYDAGHLIGNQLGGPGNIENLVPMEKLFNEAKAWKQLEQWIARCMADTVRPLKGSMKVTAHYPMGMTSEERNIPSSFTVELSFSLVSGGYAGSVTFSLTNVAAQAYVVQKNDPCPGSTFDKLTK